MKNKIKQLIQFFKKYGAYLGKLMTIIGSGLFVHNLLNFSHHTIEAKEGFCHSLKLCFDVIGVAYYYSSNTLLWLTIGVMLFVSGILILKNKK